jgi:hypothetical protein
MSYRGTQKCPERRPKHLRALDQRRDSSNGPQPNYTGVPSRSSYPLPDETPHACMGGWVFLGFEGEDEQGEHVEVIERVPCRRCRPESL